MKPKRLALALSVLALAALALSAQSPPEWTIGPFSRPAGINPLIAHQRDSTFPDPVLKKPIHWEALHTFNPAAIVRNGKVYVLYRAEDDSGPMQIGGHTSRLGLAVSDDGLHFTRHATPVFYPARDTEQTREWPGGVEDPRVVEAEDGSYVLTYTQWNRQTYSVGIATSPDLEHWTKHGPAFFTAYDGRYATLKYKSAGIVTRLDESKGRLVAARISGKYLMYWGEGAVHLATSPDLVHWSPVEDASHTPIEVLRPRPGHFDSSFPEVGPPPVLTSAGIVLLYNGKNAPEKGDPSLGANAYAAGEALFDSQNPGRLLQQTEQPVLHPEQPWEKTGQYAAGTTFAEGLVRFHNRWFLYYGCADSEVAVAATSDFALRDGDTVVMYGDSITEQNYYNQFVELYTLTRFPRWHIHFYGAGVGGDRVSGGFGGAIDERLDRDVFSRNPTVVSIMLGMNDGSYQATKKEIDDAYLTGYQHILDSIHQQAPAARITLLGPSPFDDVTRPTWFEGGYNGVLQHLAWLDRDLAARTGSQFTDLNPAVVEALKKAQELDPRLARLLLPDRVHPEPVAHWVMAESVLKGWNAPSLVSRVVIDAAAGQVTGTDNASVEALEKTENTLRWKETEEALPLPLNAENETFRELLDLTDITQALNQEPLIVTGLAPSKWKLSIDDSTLGSFTAEELAAGINLAILDTPMRHQAQEAGWSIRDREVAQMIRMRMQIRKVPLGGSASQPDPVDAFMEQQLEQIHQIVQPKQHTYTLTREP